MARPLKQGFFNEGWRIWTLGKSPLGALELQSPLVNDSYALPAQWDGNRVTAQCIHGCDPVPGPDCTCGIRFYPHTGGDLDKIVNRGAGFRADEFLTGRPRGGVPAGHWSARVYSYGIPVGPCYQDPYRPANGHGAWRHYWRTGRYDILALVSWPEHPLDALSRHHGNVQTFTFDTTRPAAETLARVAAGTARP